MILGLSRLPAWARIIMVVRRKEILGPEQAGPLHEGDYVYFLVPRDRLARLDSLFRQSPDVARRLGATAVAHGSTGAGMECRARAR